MLTLASYGKLSGRTVVEAALAVREAVGEGTCCEIVQVLQATPRALRSALQCFLSYVAHLLVVNQPEKSLFPPIVSSINS